MPNVDQVIKEHFGKPHHEVPYEEKYEYLIGLIGLENAIPYIPYSKIILLNAYEAGNVNFNSNHYGRTGFNLITWEQAGCRLFRAYQHKTGITSWSLSQGVCIMKEVARLSIKDEVRCAQ